MSTAPQWAAVDDDVANLLTLVADGPAEVDTYVEWDFYVAALRYAAMNDNLIFPNVLRPLVRGNVAPRRISAFTHRAQSLGLVEYTGEFQISDDREGRNAGRPMRVMRWLGGAR